MTFNPAFNKIVESKHIDVLRSVFGRFHIAANGTDLHHFAHINSSNRERSITGMLFGTAAETAVLE